MPLSFEGGELRAFGPPEVEAYIRRVRWQFARTMPQWPHEYTVRSWRPDLDAEFAAFATLIRTAGGIKPWPRTASKPRYQHTYLTIEEWEYWTMGAPIPETTVINRARLEDAEAEEGKLPTTAKQPPLQAADDPAQAGTLSATERGLDQ
jgi:hypothetical protein